MAEVHNTYGQRHRYLLETDARGRAETGKQFYVSPFYEVAGRYTMRLPEPDDRLDLSITLHPPQGATFVASVRGRRVPAHGLPLVRMLLGRPWATAAVSMRDPLARNQAVPARAACRPAHAREHDDHHV